METAIYLALQQVEVVEVVDEENAKVQRQKGEWQQHCCHEEGYETEG